MAATNENKDAAKAPRTRNTASKGTEAKTTKVDGIATDPPTPTENAIEAQQKRIDEAEPVTITTTPVDPTAPESDVESEETLEEREKRNVEAEQARDDAARASVSQVAKDGKFEGQVHTSEHFFIETHSDLNGTFAEIKPRNWMGEGLRVSPFRFKELVELIGKVKNLPKE